MQDTSMAAMTLLTGTLEKSEIFSLIERESGRSVRAMRMSG